MNDHGIPHFWVLGHLNAKGTCRSSGPHPHCPPEAATASLDIAIGFHHE
jgi:hypothetical protein